MTEAVTSHEQPDEPPLPSASPEFSAAPELSTAPSASPERVVSPADIRDGAAITLAVGVAGVLLGLLWVWLAPRVQYVSNGEAVFLRDTESEARIGSDAVFFLLALGFGALSAAAVFLWRRRGGVAQVVGLVLGSAFGALAGWQLGLRLGPSSDLVAVARRVGKGVPFDAPMELLAHGALLAWPMAAVIVHLALTALWGPREVVAPPMSWPSYYQAPADAAPDPAPADAAPDLGPAPSATEPPRP